MRASYVPHLVMALAAVLKGKLPDLAPPQMDGLLESIKHTATYCSSPFAALQNGPFMALDHDAMTAKNKDLHAVLLTRATVAAATLQVAKDRHSI